MIRRLLPFLVACASSSPKPPAAPSYAPIPLEAAPPQADLYANCLAESIASHRYQRARDRDTTILVFTCTGAPALAFFDGLAGRDTEFTRDGQTFRSTARVQHDLFGVDYCSREQCIITLNVGDFMR